MRESVLVCILFCEQNLVGLGKLGMQLFVVVLHSVCQERLADVNCCDGSGHLVFGGGIDRPLQQTINILTHVRDRRGGAAC
jgi:hypothetical protein